MKMFLNSYIKVARIDVICVNVSKRDVNYELCLKCGIMLKINAEAHLFELFCSKWAYLTLMM